MSETYPWTMDDNLDNLFDQYVAREQHLDDLAEMQRAYWDSHVNKKTDIGILVDETRNLYNDFNEEGIPHDIIMSLLHEWVEDRSLNGDQIVYNSATGSIMCDPIKGCKYAK